MYLSYIFSKKKVKYLVYIIKFHVFNVRPNNRIFTNFRDRISVVNIIYLGVL